jgi:hypothetical protein
MRVVLVPDTQHARGCSSVPRCCCWGFGEEGWLLGDRAMKLCVSCNRACLEGSVACSQCPNTDLALEDDARPKPPTLNPKPQFQDMKNIQVSTREGRLSLKVAAAPSPMHSVHRLLVQGCIQVQGLDPCWLPAMWCLPTRPFVLPSRAFNKTLTVRRPVTPSLPPLQVYSVAGSPLCLTASESSPHPALIICFPPCPPPLPPPPPPPRG